MTIPVSVQDETQPKRSTQRWVKIVWAFAAATMLFSALLIFIPVSVNLDGKAASCGSVFSSTDSEAQELGDAVRDERRRSSVSARLAVPEFGDMLVNDCAATRDGRSGDSLKFMLIAVTLTVVGFIGRARPAIPVRIRD